MLATICIPVAPYHLDTAQRAIDSARAQTLPCAVEVYEDTQARGAAFSRNAAAARAQTPFLVFLDADDELHPRFAELTAHTYARGQFVYSDWIDDDGRRRVLPDCTGYGGWLRGETFHLITTLLPTAAFRAVGGFDEQTDLEDAVLYMRLLEWGMCGIRCPEPLVTYHTRAGVRSKAHPGNAALEERLRSTQERLAPMCGCNNRGTNNVAAQGQQQPGDVLAEALYAPMTQIGRATRRFYPRAGHGDKLWVDRRDVELTPGMWRVVSTSADITPAVDDVRRMALEALVQNTQTGV